ncbi:multivesicular body subunit 12A-like [Conger conger]|uniref:multivesicular body subunit 12A-like n=1 Tax=Conger conger TaxID=82655 RepID=UPI002A599042|nr:multivesicular body subunit 12A-like [Conger conger]
MSHQSLREPTSAPCLPVTAVAWTSTVSTCPKDLTLISTTEEGAAANFVRGFGKTGYYLCYSRKTGGGMVVSDIQVISEKDSTPHGYCYIPEYLEPKTSLWRKKRVCVRVMPLGTVERAVLDIKVTTKSKALLPQYTCLGDIHGFVIWCKRGVFSGPTPKTMPRSISLDIRKISLDPPVPSKLPKTSNGPIAPEHGKLSQRRGNLHKKDNMESIAENSVNIPSAMDGIPFALHPKFESQSSKVPSDTLNFRIKSAQDIQNEYNYAFTVEEKASKREPPRTSLAPSSHAPPVVPPRPN